MVQRPNLVGQQFGSYKLLRLLGAGGFAEVYLGEHIDLGTQAAIKVLHTYTQLTSNVTDAFLKEARTIASLLHPHIIRVLDFNDTGTTPFLVMDYAAGGTMRKRYPRGTTVHPNVIVSSIQQVADALQYAHNEKLIHRDIKPENILLDQHDNVFLSDFGIAIVMEGSRYQTAEDILGTATYMSPEQIQGKPQPASDQYSLGVIVYEWLCGDSPFHGSFAELCSQHMHAPPPPLHARVPTIPLEIERVVMRALEKDPNQRFDSVRAFAIALQQAYQGGQQQIVTTPHSPASITIPVSQPGPPQPINPAHAQTTSSTKWKRVGKPKWAYLTRGPVTSSPTVVNGIVYIGSHDHNLYALETASGKQKWFCPTKGKVVSSPTVTNGVVYFCSRDRHLYALDTASGEPKWSFTTSNWIEQILLLTVPTSSPTASSPTAGKTIIYFVSGNHKLCALDAASQQREWSFATRGRIQSSPTVVDGIAYIGSNDGKLHAIFA